MMTPTKFASLACPQTLAAALEPVTDIPVERLTTGTTILLRGGDWTGFAEVYEIQFDGWEGYEITFCTDERAAKARAEYMASPEYRAFFQRQEQGHAMKIQPGKGFRDFMREASDADSARRAAIAAAHNVPAWRV